MMNHNEVNGYRLIFAYLGYFMILMGIIILFPLFVVIFYPETSSEASYFIIPGVITIIIGYLQTLIIRGKKTAKLERHQDIVLIFLTWIIAIIAASFPFFLSGNYSFTQSVFESTSGFSTTGLTVVDVSQASKIFLMYRSLLQFFGGVGLVLVLTSAISDKYGMRLYHAEGHNDKLLPNLAKSARLILSIYVIYIILGTVSYTWFGMSIFDAINHSIASLSTGGFSTKTSSIGFYQSFPIELITIVLMILGSTNLLIHLFLMKAKFKKAFHHIEVQLSIVLICLFIPFMTINLLSNTSLSIIQSMRISVFQFTSALTTTGFQTVDSFTYLPPFFNFSVIIMMVIGGGIGSTSGGIKQYRIGLELKQLYWNIRDRLSHQRTLHTNYIKRFGKDIVITEIDTSSNHSFIILYILTLMIGTLIFTTYGYSIRDSLFEFSSALGTVGLSIGIISNQTPSPLLWTTIFGMILGRLEFYVVIIALAKMAMDGVNKKVL